MDIITFALLYITGILLFAGLFLFGDLLAFAHTPLPWLQWLVASAPCEGVCYCMDTTSD